MPRLKTRQPKFKPDDVAVAWMAHAVDLPDGGSYTVRRGTRLRGAHPAVQANPAYFLPDGASAEDIPKPATPEPEPEPRQFYRPAPRIPDEEAAVCIRTFSVGGLNGSRHVEKGQRLRRDDPLVQKNPELFRTPAMRLPESEKAAQA